MGARGSSDAYVHECAPGTDLQIKAIGKNDSEIKEFEYDTVVVR
jgi:hypothetical protein